MMAWVNDSSINLIFDGVMAAAILGLWVMWFQQARQRKKVENMLQQASADLQQATTLLDKMMQEKLQYEKSQKQMDLHDKPMQETRMSQANQPKTTAEKIRAKLLQQDKVSIGQRVPKRQTTKAMKPSKSQDVDTVAMISRLNREGLDLKAISKQLGLPIAQVKLMLLLQKAQA
jgi:hypothetical protein